MMLHWDVGSAFVSSAFIRTPTADHRAVAHKNQNNLVAFGSTIATPPLMDAAAANPDSQQNSSAHNPAGVVVKLENEEDYRSQLHQVSPDTLVVIKLYSPVCKACQALAPKFARLAKNDADSDPTKPIRFAELPLQSTTQSFIHDELRVEALPSIQIYRGPTLLETFPCGPSKIGMLKRKLEEWSHPHEENTTAATTRTTSSSSSSHVVITKRVADYFDPDGDIPLQASDLFLMDDDDNDEDDDTFSSSSLHTTTTKATTDFFDPDGDIPLQASDLFLMDESLFDGTPPFLFSEDDD